MATADKLQKLVNGKQYVIDKTNAKAGTSLNIKSKWKDIGDVIENISGGSALIKGDWQGTVVPNSGYVENVYFNTNLSNEEVVSLLEKLTYNADGQSLLLSPINDNRMYMVMTMDGVYAIGEMDSQTMYFTSADIGMGVVGWNADITYPIVINDEADNSISIPNIGACDIGVENHLLTSLFSTTPFVQSTLTLEGEYDGSTLTITELPSGGGTAVPNTGYVENVYFNTNLSADEVYNILSKLTYIETPFLTYPVYPILFANDGNPVMFVAKYIGSVSNLTYYDIYLSTDITNPETAVKILNMDSPNDILIVEFNNTEYTINKEVINNFNGLPIGFQNDLISSLVSSTPFTQSNAIDIKSLIENDKRIPLQIKIEGIGGCQELVDSIIDGTIENLTTNAETIETYKFYNNTNLKTFNAPNAKTIKAYAFNGNTALISLNAPNVTVGTSLNFKGCTNLKTFNAPNISSIPSFENCTNLEEIILNKASGELKNYTFKKCAALIKALVEKPF